MSPVIACACCSHQNPAAARFCNDCGAALGGFDSEPREERARLRAELERMYQNEDSATVSRGVMDGETMAYLRRALEALPHGG
jgi:predicted amidophosphoribosyltransferase